MKNADYADLLSKTVFSVSVSSRGRFSGGLSDLKRPIFESDSV